MTKKQAGVARLEKHFYATMLRGTRRPISASDEYEKVSSEMSG
jgi:hypothetical protein